MNNSRLCINVFCILYTCISIGICNFNFENKSVPSSITIPSELKYDEYGAIVTVLECFDSDFKYEYIARFQKLGASESVSKFFVSWILPFIVVPLRWTYAPGFSSLYFLFTFINIASPLYLIVFQLPALLLNVFTIRIILCSPKLYFKGYSLIVVVILLSEPFSYWLFTVSSYGNHLFLFNLIYICLFGRLSRFSNCFIVGLLGFFNYQYCLLSIGISAFYCFLMKPFSNKRKSTKIFLFCLLVSINGVLIVYIALRPYLSGKHSNPQSTILSYNEQSKPYIQDNLDSFLGLTSFITQSIYEVTSYYYGKNLFLFSYSLLSLCLVVYQNFRSPSKRDIIMFLILVLLALPYLLGLQPITATRHCLHLIIPCTYFLITPWVNLIPKIINAKHDLVTGILLIILTSFFKCSYKNNQPSLYNLLNKYKVDQMICAPCDFVPIINKKIYDKYHPIHGCGPLMISKIKQEAKIIAYVSTTPLKYDSVQLKLKEYFLIDKKPYITNQCYSEAVGGCYIYIMEIPSGDN